MTSAQAQEYDPITFSVILSRFNSIANEMTLTLEYTAWTSILSLARDYSCAIYDAKAQQIAMFDALPIHTTSMHLALAEIAEEFEGEVDEGDVYLFNHPFRRNTHAGDVVTAQPVFYEGKHVFWSVTKGHQMDIGAATPTSVPTLADDVYGEGLHVPPVKLYDKGELNKGVLDLYMANVRYEDLSRGDMLAQLGSIGIGTKRLVELCDDYGADVVMAYSDHIIDYADRRMSAAIEAMPDGVYEAEAWIDNDGAKRTNIPIKARVEIAGDMVHVDFTGSGAQGGKGVNGTYATTTAAAAIPFLFFIPSDIPHNQGCIKHIEVTAPEGTICNAKFPAATASATVVPSDQIQNVISKALADAVPDGVLAGWPAAGNIPMVVGIDERNGVHWGMMSFNNGGGGAASKGADGWPLITTPAAAGGLKAFQIEQMELLYPILVESWEVVTDSMGAGEWIGGPGAYYSFHPTHGPLDLTTTGDGMSNPPHGVCGGTPGAGGTMCIEDVATGRKRFVSTICYVEIPMGHRYVGVSTGGGGYGRPEARPVEQVRQDVRDGWISRERAREEFGVVVSDDFDPIVDLEMTEERRTELRTLDRPSATPDQPAASRLLEASMGPDDTYDLNPQLR
jgi:N-methylhydantoinase B